MKKVIRVNQIKLAVNHSDKDLKNAIIKSLGSNVQDVCYDIHKRSFDCRHKPDIYYVYSVNVEEIVVNNKKYDANGFANLLKKNTNKNKKKAAFDIVELKEFEFDYKCESIIEEDARPVIVGFGPAGIFAAYELAKAGYRPVVYERGKSVDERKKDVSNYWKTGYLNVESNVQFGEGGAGTFSDGKLNTMIKDPSGRIKHVLKTFVEFGAKSDILYVNKPHIGTDVLENVVKNMRKFIIESGGEINFNSKIVDFDIQENVLKGIYIENTDNQDRTYRKCSKLCLAIGHSARDTFEVINGKRIIMNPKAFAVGLRIEHPQSFIDYNAYGGANYKLPAADYKVTYNTAEGRGVYSFCMCPGGYVVNASSEKDQIAVNGMSYSGRNGQNANSALIVTVTPDDFGSGVLDGVEFQRKLEKFAFIKGNGNIPIQLLGDFKQKKISTGLGKVIPSIKGEYNFADLNTVLPEYIANSIVEAAGGFDKMIKGFDMEEAVLSGVESRTSSPVRIVRNDELQSSVAGIYPCGEGAGYAGGITSAAVDGIKVAHMMVK